MSIFFWPAETFRHAAQLASRSLGCSQTRSSSTVDCSMSLVSAPSLPKRMLLSHALLYTQDVRFMYLSSTQLVYALCQQLRHSLLRQNQRRGHHECHCVNKHAHRVQKPCGAQKVMLCSVSCELFSTRTGCLAPRTLCLSPWVRQCCFGLLRENTASTFTLALSNSYRLHRKSIRVSVRLIPDYNCISR